MKYFIVFFVCFIASNFLNTTHAQTNESSRPTMTVINPIRGQQLGLEDVNLLASLKGQWEVTNDLHISATWLWQYSALEDKNLMKFAKKDMKNQEFGIFLEIDKNMAEKAGIPYKGKGPWYHSDGLLLNSYDQAERRKFIDMVFEKFKQEFGYYPETVGAWWVGADSIEYMREKYHIVAVLQCADQFETDAYALWGTPWSIPYIPSKTNAAMPAQTKDETKNNVVILQWASRDPLRGYGKSVEESKYSVQDMKFPGMVFPEIKYYDYLSDIYLKKPYDQTVIGLEGGLSPGLYTILYKKQLERLRTWENEGKIQIQTAQEYGTDYLKRGEILPPTSAFLTKDFKNDNQSFWYHSPYYRIGIHKIGDTISLIDFRDYQHTPSEDFQLLPSTQRLIRVNTKGIVDSIRFPQQKQLLATSKQPLQVTTAHNVTTLTSGSFIARFSENDVTLPTRSYHFTSGQFIPYEMLFVVGIIITYLIVILVMTKQKPQRIVSILCFLISVAVIAPLLTNGAFFTDNYVFNQAFLSLLSVAALFPLSPAWTIFVAFQVIPLIAIILLHMILTKKVKNLSLLFAIYTLCSIFFLICSNALWQPVIELFGQGKKMTILGAGIMLLFFSGVGLVLYLCLKKHTRFFFITSSVFVILFLATNYAPLKSKSFIITPFEMEALNVLFQQKKDVLYLSPQRITTIQEYKAIYPLLVENIQIGATLTKTHWQKVPQKQDNGFTLSDYKQKIVFVPMYQGSSLFDGERKQYNMKKFFDNAQIELYWIK